MIKYTTLWDIMKDFNAITFAHTIDILGKMHWDWGRDEQRQMLSQKERVKYSAKFKAFQQVCLHLKLDVSAEATRRIVNAFSSGDITFKSLDELGQYLLQILYDEMRSRLFFSMEPSKQSYIQEKHQFGAEVTLAFPSATIDIEEAGKCLAFDRATACVFHLMHVMEAAVRVLENNLKLPPSNNPSWESILKNCESELKKRAADKSPEWESNKSFFTEAIAMLRSVKDAWRNPTMHVEKTYTEEQALDIWNVVKVYMRHLATKLKEDTA